MRRNSSHMRISILRARRKSRSLRMDCRKHSPVFPRSKSSCESQLRRIRFPTFLLRPPMFFRKKTPKKATVARAGAATKKDDKAAFTQPGGLKRFGLALANLGLGKFRSPFLQNMAMMLGAGLHVTDALGALEREAKKGPMRKLISTIHADVDNGMAL